LAGGAIGLMADMLSEGASQAFYARLPGHAEQADDSMEQSGKDRDLYRFRGETRSNYAARLRSAFDDYAQAGTAIQLKRVLNQWGAAGWPLTWDPSLLTVVESGIPGSFTFTVTIGFGSIIPAWVPVYYGVGGYTYGEGDLFYGIGPSSDLPILLYLVRKWKPSRSRGLVRVYYDAINSVVFTV
jgi:hypothetical protein